MSNPFLNALPIIINALSDTLGVKVMLNAGNPRTDGKIVYLPAIDANDPRSCIKALGFSVHEGGGHCRFTDFTVLEGGLMPIEKSVWNILEDIRVEKAISGVYPGARLYLSDMVELLVEDGFFGIPKGDESPTSLMQMYMLYQLRLKVLGQEGIKPLSEAVGTLFEENIPLGMRVRLEALMFEVENCSSSQDVLDLSRVILRMMQEEAKKEEEKENRQGSPEQGGDGQPDPGQSNKGSGQQQDQGQDNPAPTNSPNRGQVEKLDGNGKPKASEVIKQIISSGDDEAIKGVGEILAETLAQGTATGDEPASAVPFRNVPFPAAKDENVTYLDEVRNRVAGATNALRVRAQSLLQAQTMTTRRSAYFGTKLNLKNLHQAPLGGPVFIKEHKGSSVDTAIEVLVDRSPSMSRNMRIRVALDAALATTMAFNRPDVKTAVLAFPYLTKSNAVLKGWNDLPAAAVSAYSRIGVGGNDTPMAEAMLGACLSLIQRPEKRKVLLVNTDGKPSNLGQARWVIDLARRSGIEVLGLGIELDVSSVFGREWSASVSTVGDLPVAMISLLDRVMLRKAA